MGTVSQEVIIIAFLSLFITIIITAIILLILVYQKRQIRFIKEKENIQVLHKNEILQTQLEIQEQTLQNISQEIHDNIGQALSLVKLHINTMDTSEPASLQNKINNSRNLITKAIQDLRDLSKSLHTDYAIDKGLPDAIEYELEMIKKAGKYQTCFKVEGNPYRMENQQELVFLRIVQEALHNIMKHAKATEISIVLTFRPDIFLLKISDNGIGFPTSGDGIPAFSKTGLGIRNMNHRSAIINCQFTLRSLPGEGTSITVTLPFQNLKST